MSDLLLCPFCGDDHAFVWAYAFGDSDVQQYMVSCKQCESETAYCDNPTKAIDMWNTRTSPKLDKLEAEVERLETMVRWARADSAALNIENKRYKEALDRIANDESCDEGAENIHDWPCMVAKAALDGDKDVK